MFAMYYHQGCQCAFCRLRTKLDEWRSSGRMVTYQGQRWHIGGYSGPAGCEHRVRLSSEDELVQTTVEIEEVGFE